MSAAVCVVLLGPPGAGKSTQGALLADRFGLRRIASGELLHEEVRAGTTLGRAVGGYMAAGDLVPDDLLVDVVTGAIAAAPAGVVLDGFPRRAAQARLADEVLGRLGWAVLAAIEFRVDPAAIRARLARRAAGGRFDDTPAVVEQRLRVGYPPADLLAHYRDRGLLHSVAADRPVKDIAAQLVSIVARSPQPGHGSR
jgi:adenylate kinase